MEVMVIIIKPLLSGEPISDVMIDFIILSAGVVSGTVL